MTTNIPPLLIDLLNARSPSGYEAEAQAVVDKYLEPVAEAYQRDALGNRLATLNPEGSPTLMLAGHMDELGLIIKYIDKAGFLFFDTIIFLIKANFMKETIWMSITNDRFLIASLVFCLLEKI